MKYNRPALETEYMARTGNENDESGLSVDDFLIYKGIRKGKGKANGNDIEKTLGRQEKKRVKQEEIAEEAQKKATEIAIKKYTIKMVDMMEIKAQALNLVRARTQQLIKRAKEGEEINPKELETILKLTKTELGEPTTITKNENNDTVKIEENLSEDEEAFIKGFVADADANKK